jgi:hypothetical protein
LTKQAVALDFGASMHFLQPEFNMEAFKRRVSEIHHNKIHVEVLLVGVPLQIIRLRGNRQAIQSMEFQHGFVCRAVWKRSAHHAHHAYIDDRQVQVTSYGRYPSSVPCSCWVQLVQYVKLAVVLTVCLYIDQCGVKVDLELF